MIVTAIELVDDHYGIIIDVKVKRKKFALPLCDLEILDKDTTNYQLVDDYSTWYANR